MGLKGGEDATQTTFKSTQSLVSSLTGLPSSFLQCHPKEEPSQALNKPSLGCPGGQPWCV